MSWVEKTRRLYETRPANIKQEDILRNTGISQGWLQKFLYRRDFNPGIENVQRLHDYLESVR